MSIDAAGLQAEVAAAFKDAEAKDLLEYINTLVRVDGIRDPPDPLDSLREALQAATPSDVEGMQQQYARLANDMEAMRFLWNLLGCIGGEPYDVHPFLRGDYPSVQRLSWSEFRAELAGRARQLERNALASMMAAAFDETAMVPGAAADHVATSLEQCRLFLTTLLDAYAAERLRWRVAPRYVKLLLPRFEVLELLSNDTIGLFGFRMHFSNGNRAEFSRDHKGTMAINISLGRPVGFNVGMLDELRHEWRIGDQRLYEIGLPGRYNTLGEWKPILYPGDFDPLIKEAVSASADDDVRGALFYMLATGHRVIEFVVRADVDLPMEYVNLSTRAQPPDVLHLWKCPVDDEAAIGMNYRLYDGWVDVTATDPEHLRSAITMIGVALSRLAFAYRLDLKWRTKYRMSQRIGCLATPSKEDLDLFDSLLRDFPSSEDAAVLYTALDWYSRGVSAANVFNRFLCHYVAIESVTSAMASGSLRLGPPFPQASRHEIDARRSKCIHEKAAALMAVDPVRFAREAYFECVESLNRRTRTALGLVFGDKHPHIAAMFDHAEDGHSLNSIRSGIAHGSLSLLDPEHEALVSHRCGEIERIASEFLSRLVFRLKEGDSLPSWSQHRKFSVSSCDPRSTLATTTLEPFPSKEWKIRPEWCD